MARRSAIGGWLWNSNTSSGWGLGSSLLMRASFWNAERYASRMPVRSMPEPATSARVAERREAAHALRRRARIDGAPAACDWGWSAGPGVAGSPGGAVSFRHPRRVATFERSLFPAVRCRRCGRICRGRLPIGCCRSCLTLVESPSSIPLPTRSVRESSIHAEDARRSLSRRPLPSRLAFHSGGRAT